MTYFNNTDQECGLYYILNIKTKDIYIGSSIMLTKRYKEHFLKLKTNKHVNKHLQRSFNLHTCDSFEFHVFKTFDNITDHKLRFYEGLCIRLFKAEYNMCVFPEDNGKPNYKKTFSKEWAYNLHLNNNYKHKDDFNVYEKIVIKNKNSATKIELIIDNKILLFNTLKSACLHLNLKTFNRQHLFYNCDLQNITYKVIKSQRKKVKLTTNNNILYFNSAGECDKFLNLWRGCTSNAICHLNGKLFENRVTYIL